MTVVKCHRLSNSAAILPALLCAFCIWTAGVGKTAWASDSANESVSAAGTVDNNLAQRMKTHVDQLLSDPAHVNEVGATTALRVDRLVDEYVRIKRNLAPTIAKVQQRVKNDRADELDLSHRDVLRAAAKQIREHQPLLQTLHEDLAVAAEKLEVRRRALAEVQKCMPTAQSDQLQRLAKRTGHINGILATVASAIEQTSQLAAAQNDG